MIKSFLSAVGLSLNSFTIILTIGIVVVMLVVMYRYWKNFYKKQDLIIISINDTLEKIGKLEIKNANITDTIVAGAINLNTATITGTLDVSHIDVDNMTVANAVNVTGTINADQIQAGTLSADRINAGTLSWDKLNGYIPYKKVSSEDSELKELFVGDLSAVDISASKAWLPTIYFGTRIGGTTAILNSQGITLNKVLYSWNDIVGKTATAVFG